MKTMKVALLATAGLAAVSVSARADQVSDMKAQLEALNARIAKLEAAPAVPTGFSLLTVSQTEASAVPGLPETDKSYGTKATVIGVMPAADMPASTTVEWSGFVRAAIAYDTYDLYNGDHDVNIWSRGEIKVKAKTDTAVGEVGVLMKLRANFQVNDGRDINSNVVSPEYWGYWAMTPEWTYGVGFSGTLANIGFGLDGACTCYYTDNADAADFNPNDTAQMRLSYVSGPLSFAVAVEDGSAKTGNNDVLKTLTSSNSGLVTNNTDDSMGVAGELKYSGDTVSGEISGGYWGKDDFDPNFNDADATKYQIGAGLGFALGDMANLSIGGVYGGLWGGAKYWGVSGLLTADLSETVSAELGAAYKAYKNGGAAIGVDPTSGVLYDYARGDQWTALAGVYWKPVDQLKIGVEGEYIKGKGAKGEGLVDLVSVFSF